PGYVAGNPHSGRSPFRDFWYYTGDLFTVISDDKLQYQERETNIIKRNGMSVIPADVEAVLLEIPGVIAACVVGIDDSETGEMIAAALVSAPIGPKLSALNVIRTCRHKLPFFAVPQYVEFVEHLPCDVNGKILHRRVREHISEAVSKRSKRSNVN